MSDSVLLDELMEPLARCLDAVTAERIAAFQIAPSVQDRVATLAHKANQGMIAEAERSEYEALVSAADFIAILQLKARRGLTQLPASD